MAKEKKQLRQLSDEELEKVTGGKDKQEGSNKCTNSQYASAHPQECTLFTAGINDEGPK